MGRPRSTGMRFIEVRTLSDGRKSYRVTVPHPVTEHRARMTFTDLAVAQRWRDKTVLEGEQSQVGLYPKMTVTDAAERFLAAARAGQARAKKGEVYKPSVIRGYESSLRNRVLPYFGKTQLSAVSSIAVMDWADGLIADLSPSTARNHVTALRVVYRWAKRKGWCAANPCDGATLAAQGKDAHVRDRIAPPEEAEQMLAHLADPQSRLLYALAFYSGLRRGELGALRWDDVDLPNRVIRVTRSFDQGVDGDDPHHVSAVLGWPESGRGAFVRPKSKAAVRTVPIPNILMEHLLAQDRTSGLVVGNTPGVPFTDQPMRFARIAWEAAGLEPIGLHECRHTYASLMIAAGVNAKTLQTILGHSSIVVTMDRYGHLMPGTEADAADLLDAYMTKALAREPE